jgi:hypothetical protein
MEGFRVIDRMFFLVFIKIRNPELSFFTLIAFLLPGIALPYRSGAMPLEDVLCNWYNFNDQYGGLP